MASHMADRAAEPPTDSASILPSGAELHGGGTPLTAGVADAPRASWAAGLLGRVRRPSRSSAKLAAGRRGARDWAYLTQVGSRLQGDAWMRLLAGERRRDNRRSP